MADLLGDGIFTVDGSMWLHQRKLSSRQFSTRFLKDYSTSIFKKNASRIVDVVSEAAETGKIIDFQASLSFIFLATVRILIEACSWVLTGFIRAFDDGFDLRSGVRNRA